MGYIKQGNTMLLCGKVMREAKLRHTKNGKAVSSFSVQYGSHHDEDGKTIYDYMDVSMWGENAAFIGDESIGVAKGDIVFVIGYLVKDKYHTTDNNDPQYKISAEIILDMTSIFQVAQMVVEAGFSPDVPAEAENTPKTPKKQSVFADVDDSDNDNPFMPKEVEEENDLPY